MTWNLVAQIVVLMVAFDLLFGVPWRRGKP